MKLFQIYTTVSRRRTESKSCFSGKRQCWSIKTEEFKKERLWSESMPSKGMQILSNSTQVIEHRLIWDGRDPGRSPVLPCPSYSSSGCIHIYSLIPPACFPVCLSLCTGTQGGPFWQGLSPISIPGKLKLLSPSHPIPRLRPSPAVWQAIWQECSRLTS